jgi:hypothetical protein
MIQELFVQFLLVNNGLLLSLGQVLALNMVGQLVLSVVRSVTVRALVIPEIYYKTNS